MAEPQTLAARVRAKHPGAYDDLSDQQLEAAVVAKFPGVYDDIPKTEAAPPEAAPSPTPGVLARQQSREHPGRYLREMVENVPGDVVRAGKGVIGLLEMAGNAQKELHQNVIGVGREFFGYDPNYTDTPNVRAVAALPGNIVSHYAGYLDPDERALRVRDRPVSTLLDIAGAKGAVQGGTAAMRPVGLAARDVAARATAAAMKAPARVIDTAVGAVRGYASGNPMPAIRGAMGQGPMSQATSLLRPRTQPVAPVASHPTATAQDALRQEVMSRAEQIKANEALAAERLGPGFDYRTTDAVKLDAMTRDIGRPGGFILEAGESRIGLGERLAEALGRAEKAKTPAAAEAALTEARRLAKAARQRMHIAEKQAR